MDAVTRMGGCPCGEGAAAGLAGEGKAAAPGRGERRAQSGAASHAPAIDPELPGEFVTSAPGRRKHEQPRPIHQLLQQRYQPFQLGLGLAQHHVLLDGLVGASGGGQCAADVDEHVGGGQEALG
eukprot:scaffold10240_cov107-Isochrysis_galbana.AAC.9